MRLLLVLLLMVVFTSLKAQTFFPGLYGSTYASNLHNDHHLYDSANKKNWFISKSVGITAGYNFFRGGNAGIISAPVSLQLNRRLNDNLYAFAGVSVAPSYINFSNAFLNTNLNKAGTGNNFYRRNNIGVYPGAAVGLMYMNDAKTFSISGSISVEKTNYPVYYYNPVNAGMQQHSLPTYR